MRVLLSATALAVLVACPSDPAPEPTPLPASSLQWSVEGVDAGDIDFGELEVGEDAAVDVLLENVGGEPIASLRVEGPDDAALRLTPAVLPSFLGPGETTSVRVHFRPTVDASIDDRIAILSDAANAPDVAIAVLAEALGPMATLRAPDLDLLEVGCTAVVPLTLRHDGRGGEVLNRDLILTGEDVASFTSLRAPGSFTLGPGEEAALQVVFEPSRRGEHSVEATAEGDTAADAAAVSLAVEAIAAAPVEDVFVQSEGARVDVLFVVDDDDATDRSALVAAAQALIVGLDAHGLDWQIGALSSDVAELGQLRSPPLWVHPDHPDPEAALQALLDVGDEPSTFDQGLHQAYLALNPPMVDGANSGFVRGSSLLHVVFVSAGEDMSAPASGWTALQYAEFFDGLGEDPSDTVVSSIVGGRTGCSGTRSANPAPRYVDVAEAGGGVSYSFCSPSWAPAMAGIADDSRRRARRFTPASEILEGTLQVEVDGAPLPEGAWTWDGVDVVLDAAPPSDARVVLRYAPLGCR